MGHYRPLYVQLGYAIFVFTFIFFDNSTASIWKSVKLEIHRKTYRRVTVSILILLLPSIKHLAFQWTSSSPKQAILNQSKLGMTRTPGDRSVTCKYSSPALPPPLPPKKKESGTSGNISLAATSFFSFSPAVKPVHRLWRERYAKLAVSGFGQ